MSAEDTLSTAFYAVSVVSAVFMDMEGAGDGTAQTAVDRESAAHATPTISNSPRGYDAPMLFAGYATDWDWMNMAYPVSATDADEPFVGDVVCVGDVVG